MPDREAGAVTRPTISAAWAGQMIDAAVTAARAMSVAVTVVVVDESGVLKGMLRMDGAPLVSVQTAVNKAYAAAAIGMPPDDFYSADHASPRAAFPGPTSGTRPGQAVIRLARPSRSRRLPRPGPREIGSAP